MTNKTTSLVSVYLAKSRIELHIKFADIAENAIFFGKLVEAIRDRSLVIKAGDYTFEDFTRIE